MGNLKKIIVDHYNLIYGLVFYGLLIFGGAIILGLAARISNELGRAIFGW